MKKKARKIVYLDMDNVLVDFPSAFRFIDPEILATYRGRADEIPDIFSLMLPVPGAIEAYGFLCEHFDTYILSTAPWKNPSAWSDKLNWVKTHVGERAHKRLIITHHKNLNRGDYLIDDREKNGAAEVKGKLLLFGSKEFPDWDTGVRYLRKAAK